MRRRLLVISALTSLHCVTTPSPLFVAPAEAQGWTRPAERDSARPVDPRTFAIARLHRRISVELTEQRFEDVVRFVTEVSGVDIEVKWMDDISAIGLDPDALITLNLRNQTLLSLLERAAQRAGGDFDRPTWQMTPEGVFEIGPRSRLNETRYLRTYDVQDLLFVVPSFREVPDLDLGAIQQGGGGGGQTAPMESVQGEGMTRRERAERLVEIIISNIETDQWIDNGGDGASISELSGTLLINAPEYIHRQLLGAAYWPTDAQIRAINRGD